MPIGLATMGKFGGPPIVINTGGGGFTHGEKRKPVVRISSIQYDKDTDVNVIVTSIEERSKI